MEIKLLLLLSVYNVNFGVTPVQPHSEIENQFRNLFDSIVKNDVEKSEAYRAILKQEVAKEQYAFNAIKEVLQIARNRNGNKKINYFKISNKGKNDIVATKREAKKSNKLNDELNALTEDDSSGDSESVESTTEFFKERTTKIIRTPSTPEPSETPEEDLYIKHFGNDIYALTNGWKIARAFYHEPGEPKLKRLCEVAHEKIGYGKDVLVYEAILNLRELLFNNTNYRFRKIDVVTYRIEEGTPIQERRRYWYFTEGVRKDCLFYLLPDDKKARQFKLHKQVCGVQVF